MSRAGVYGAKIKQEALLNSKMTELYARVLGFANPPWDQVKYPECSEEKGKAEGSHSKGDGNPPAAWWSGHRMSLPKSFRG